MRTSWQLRFIASLVLMAYAITGTAIMPAAMALVAWMDGSHSVLISQSEEGTQLTLHHRQDAFTPAVEDHQNALTRAIVSLCRASEGGDHQLKSGRIDASSSNSRGSSEDVVKRVPELNVIQTTELLLSFRFPASVMTRPLPVVDLSVTTTSLAPLLATVQLLI